MLSTATIMHVFEQEITTRSGTVLDTFDDGKRLFTRSLLPEVEEVQAKDRLQGGVALRATESDVWVHPYVFREVCRNGAIMAHALYTHRLEDLDWQAADEATETLRDAITACCAPEAFAAATEEIRSSLHSPLDLALTVLPWLSRFADTMPGVFGMIMNRFFDQRDHSRFGLMNAVTSVARDTPDPERRWRLEELGGGIAAATIPEGPVGELGAEVFSRVLSG